VRGGSKEYLHNCSDEGTILVVSHTVMQRTLPSYESVARPSNPRMILEEINLADSRKEEERLEELAEYYAIVKATEMLEMAYSRDTITAQEYNETCTKYIAQFKTMTASLMSAGLISNPEQFFKDYQIDCSKAFNRLVRDGVSATVMHGTVDTRSDVKIVAETVQAFITAMDCIKLSQWATDQVQPLISDLTASLNNVSGLPPDFDGKIKMKEWLLKLNSLRASDILSEDEARQLSFDLDNAYQAFHAFLSRN
jgi:ESCRT-I complex subunit VPS28